MKSITVAIPLILLYVLLVLPDAGGTRGPVGHPRPMMMRPHQPVLVHSGRSKIREQVIVAAHPGSIIRPQQPLPLHPGPMRPQQPLIAHPGPKGREPGVVLLHPEPIRPQRALPFNGHFGQPGRMEQAGRIGAGGTRQARGDNVAATISAYEVATVAQIAASANDVADRSADENQEHALAIIIGVNEGAVKLVGELIEGIPHYPVKH